MCYRRKTAESIAATGDNYEYARHQGMVIWMENCPLVVDETVVQDKEPPRDAGSDQPTTPIMLPDIPSQEQPMHHEPAVENITEPCVTRSGRQYVAPKRLNL